jgi:hypothetical protein
MEIFDLHPKRPHPFSTFKQGIYKELFLSFGPLRVNVSFPAPFPAFQKNPIKHP